MDKNMEQVDKHVEWLQNKQNSCAGDIFGEPQRTTRIGDEYQAQVPALMTQNEQWKLTNLPFRHDNQSHFEFGLPIPVTWVHNQHKNREKAMKIQTNEKSESGILGCGTDNDLLLFPCSSRNKSWSVNENDSFLLGLYIFGKNLWFVKKFVGNKGMQNVLSYYYGEFYRSSEHQKWSISWKKRSRMSVPGKKIFKGWRGQELLSRLLPNVTDECKTRLTQISSMFEVGELSFENYVFTLRDTVGINHLVEAVAIGKEKHDLTTKAKKRVRNKKSHTACSSLKTEEIVNILKDRIGICKERLNELFWEAVWPRLLSRGWHSEQPRNSAFQNSKHSSVFLAPGVAKFSRRSLVKGSQYFDSPNEVLNKVALEPQLLEHNPHQDVLEPYTKQVSDDEQYLKKCTIVDTSLIGLVHLTELTNLPVRSASGETEHDTTKETQSENVNHNTAENHGVVDSSECEMEISTNGQPVRELKLISKPKTKYSQGVITIGNGKISGEDEAMEDESSEKKHPRIVIDLSNPRVAQVSHGDKSLCSTKSNQHELSCPGANGQRHSRRNRPLTKKALEALANGFMNTAKKRKEFEDRTRRRVRAKTSLLSSYGAGYIENRVDGASNGSSHMISKSPK